MPENNEDLLFQSKYQITEAVGRVNFAAAVIHQNQVSPENLEKLKALNVEIFPDYPSMLAKYAGKLDICCIPTGIALHRPMTEAALAAGANVFVEKPVAPVLADAEAMEAAARKAGKFVAVGYQTIYQPETRRIKEMLLSGKGADLLKDDRVRKSYLGV